MTEKTLTTENIKPALDALRGELAPWPVVAKKQDRLNTAQLNAANSGITSSLVAQIIANTAAIRALESAITGTGLRALVVASLPAIGTLGILYIVPVTTYDPETDADVVNYSNEYIWIVAPDAPATEGYYEQVGQTGIVINNGQLTITVNGTSVGTFTANQSGDTTAAITVPTNADYVDLTTDQTVAGVKTFSSTIDGTASKAIADEDGTSIKTGYVNVAGNQTVTGQKTWSGNQFFTSSMYPKNTSYEIGNTPASNVVIPIYFTDKNNVYTGYVRNVVLTTGKTQSELYARNKFTSGALSPTGTDVSSTLQVEVQSNGDKTLYFDGSIRNNVLPYATNTYALGSSSYQWSSVYAQTYYYNGTAWGLDKENVWTGNNRFAKNAGLSDISTYSDNTMVFTANANTIFFNTRGSSNYPSYGTFLFAGYTSGSAPDRYGQLKLVRSTDIKGGTYDGYKPDSSFNLWRVAPHYSLMDFMGAVRVQNDGTNNYIAPITTNATDLGTSTNKWKTLNGVNPGALSLPDYANLIDVSGSIVPPSGESTINYSGGYNTFTPSVDGWLSIRLDGASFLQIYRNTYNCPGTTVSEPSGTRKLVTTLPVRADVTYTIVMEGNPTNTKFHLYPCLGNV